MFEIPTGVVADVYSRRLSTIIGYALMGLGFLVEGWVNQHIESRVRATVLSMTSQLDSFGQIVGGPIVDAIGTAWGL